MQAHGHERWRTFIVLFMYVLDRDAPHSGLRTCVHVYTCHVHIHAYAYVYIMAFTVRASTRRLFRGDSRRMTPQKGGVQAFCALFQMAFFLTNKEGGRQANIQKMQDLPTIGCGAPSNAAWTAICRKKNALLASWWF